jgi:dienelactone hydrolase
MTRAPARPRAARRAAGLALALMALPALGAAPAAAQFDPAYEASNFSKTNERAAIHSTPEYKALLAQVSAANTTEAARIAAADPERSFVGQTLCWSYGEGCAGDARLYDWTPKDYGQVQPVVFGARNGATLTGRVWFTRSGPAKRPGIVIVNGSVQASETLYWFAAQTLAKAGYVVLTFDPQNQGRSDSQGEAPDQSEGFPAQSDGRPFFDGAQDALDFFLSTPSAPYRPRPSCNSGTSHVPKQGRRAAQGLNAPFNPLWNLIDTARVGIAGHSYGAAGVSYVGQRDPRVKAVVAWDALREPVADGVRGPIGACVDAAERAPAAITKPALNLTADYFIPPVPNTSQPDYEEKAAVSKAYSTAGVDTGSIAIRGGTHYEFSWIPNPAFPAALRGADLTTWYTTAWFDAYVKGDPTAQRRLRTNRWRDDAPSAAVDPDGDPNMMSRYYRSRLDIGRGGERFVCEDMRAGCPGLLGDDGTGNQYDYLSIVTTPDGMPAGGPAGAPSCVAAAAVQGASARPRGTGVRFTVRPRTTVEVFRQTLHGRITRQVRVARFSRRALAFTWDGRATVGGRSGKPLDVRFRLNSAARVEVVVRRGGRVARRFAARNRAAGHTIKLRLPATATRRGAHRVTITARPVGAPAQTLRLTALRR